jgi:hypothetical protein
MHKGLNSLIILVSWEIWKHQNSCVFEGILLNIQALLRNVSDECCLWTGASKLHFLLRSLAPDS